MINGDWPGEKRNVFKLTLLAKRKEAGHAQGIWLAPVGHKTDDVTTYRKHAAAEVKLNMTGDSQLDWVQLNRLSLKGRQFVIRCCARQMYYYK